MAADSKTQNWSKTHQQKLAIMCSPMLMDNKIHTRLNVSCLLQSTEHIRLALSDIMIHEVTQKFRPLNCLEIRKTHIEDFDQCRPIFVFSEQ